MKKRTLSRIVTTLLAAVLTLGVFLSAPRASAAWSSEGRYLVGTDIPAGLYYIEATNGFGFYEVASDSSGSFESIITNDIFSTWSFIEVKDGEFLYFERAKAAPSSDIVPITARGDGIYRVGYDIPPGTYTLQSTTAYLAYAAVLKSTRGSGNIIENELFEGQYSISAQIGEFLEVSNAEIISIKATPQVPGLDFTDVYPDDWYIKNGAVKFVIDKKLMAGLSGDTFAPNSPMTRAMLVTVLHSYAKKPAPVAPNPFSDVPNGEWYTNAVAWAAENGVVTGTAPGAFSPNANVTREQLALILYKYKGAPAVAEGNLAFADAGNVSGWAVNAVKWCVANGIVSGKPGNLFDPQGQATRAEVATMLMKFVALG
jgi:hypothetical protein